MIESRKMSWEGHVAHMEDTRVAYRILVERPEGKETIKKPRRILEDNVKIYLHEVGWGNTGWNYLHQDKDR